MAEVYVSVGSNIEPRVHIRRGLKLVEERFGELKVSPVYRSAAVGFDGDDFLNLVIGFETEADPPMVTQALRCIEEHCGRDHTAPKFSDRSLDLDLILYDDEVIDTPGLRLPRGDILRYAFVLKPLADLAGDKAHPVTGETYSTLWSNFNTAEQKITAVDF